VEKIGNNMANKKITLFFVLFLLILFTVSIEPVVAQFGAPGADAPPPSPEPPLVPLSPTLPRSPLEGLRKAAESAGLKKIGGAEQTLAVFAGRILGGVLALVGLVFLGMMVYGGVSWMIARGNEQEVTKSKDIITSAIIGFIVAALGYVVTNFVFNLLQVAALGGG
jgi:hypothetical protein